MVFLFLSFLKMVSEDDMHDASDVDICEEDHNNGDALYGGGDEVGCEFFDFDSDDSDEVLVSQQKVVLLANALIISWLEDVAALSISRDSASIHLRSTDGNFSGVHEGWFFNEDEVCKAVGVLEYTNTKAAEGEELLCGICFESYPLDNTITVAACGHEFCNICWTAYICKSINDAPRCLTLRCPTPSCVAAVGVDMDNMLTSDEDKNKYHGYLLGYCTVGNRRTKWCPAPGCDYAIEFEHGSGGYDVTCSCLYRFCWNCTGEAHHPVDYETMSKWITKESKNMKLLCVGQWSDHTGGLYTCRRYESAKQEIAVATQESLRQKAVVDLQQVQTIDLARLSKKVCQPEAMLKFIVEAWLQVVECRRVLKCTYVYGYYLEVAKRQLFEYVQGEAEVGLERLHQYAEKEFHTFLEAADVSRDDFDNFRWKLVGFTRVTRTHFENLVSALEDGLFDVDTHGTTSKGKGKGPIHGGLSRTDALTQWSFLCKLKGFDRNGLKSRFSGVDGLQLKLDMLLWKEDDSKSNFEKDGEEAFTLMAAPEKQVKELLFLTSFFRWECRIHR
ncbi:unnamed protein product [Lactuca saligna]|uniref:RBR-type E3 ubiquitin transferase n=1 Tax=Lactuca saligna TaxID=75948 RepID=A0AA35ZPL0_LACSI|nr:unnamed protein product [Lactuca saligna]